MTRTEERALVVQGAGAVPVDQVKELGVRVLNNRGLFADDLTEQQALQIAMVAIAYGLDPLAGEVIPYEGKPLITLDGRIRATIETDAFDGIEETRPATEEERKAFRVKDEEDMWVARVWRKGVRFPSVGYGRAGGAYERNTLVKGSARTGYNPGRGPELARKRSIVNALRYLFPLPRPKLGADFAGFAIEGVDAEGTGVIEGGPVIEGTARELSPGATPPPDAPPSITPEQNKMIHAAAKKLNLDDEQYRGWLNKMFGVTSSKDLNANQASAAIQAMEAELAYREENAPIDAGVAEAREKAKAENRTVGEMLAPKDEPEAPREKKPPTLRDAIAGAKQAAPQGTPPPPPTVDAHNPDVTSEHDPAWRAWQELCGVGVGWGVAPSLVPALELPVAQETLRQCTARLTAAIEDRKVETAREKLRKLAELHNPPLTTTQLDGLLAHHHGEGVSLSTATVAQVEWAVRLLETGETEYQGFGQEELPHD